jgi:hypothetical protein
MACEKEVAVVRITNIASSNHLCFSALVRGSTNVDRVGSSCVRPQPANAIARDAHRPVIRSLTTPSTNHVSARDGRYTWTRNAIMRRGAPDLSQSLDHFLCVPQRPLSTRQKHIFHPILVRRHRFAVPNLGGKKRPESSPRRMLAAFQILLSFDNRFFKSLDAIKDSLLLWVHGASALVLQTALGECLLLN